MRKMGGKYLAKKKLTSRQDTKDHCTKGTLLVPFAKYDEIV